MYCAAAAILLISPDGDYMGPAVFAAGRREVFTGEYDGTNPRGEDRGAHAPLSTGAPALGQNLI